MHGMKRLSFSMWVCLLPLVMTGCGKKTAEPTEGPRAAAQVKPTPIDPSTVGTITGQVRFEGRKPKMHVLRMDADPACTKGNSAPVYAEDGKVNANGTLPNVFVYVKSGAEKYVFAPPTQPAVLDQVGCMYRPHVLGLMAGQPLKVVNSDITIHNVHIRPKKNREWNLSQLAGAPPIIRKFSQPEIMIPVECNQHPWMKAYIGVTANPFYAVTGSKGAYTLKGLPPGHYTVAAWTATFGTQEKETSIAPSAKTTLDFTFKGD
jgi:Carboxypeptidase regulatory-like domain